MLVKPDRRMVKNWGLQEIEWVDSRTKPVVSRLLVGERAPDAGHARGLAQRTRHIKAGASYPQAGGAGGTRCAPLLITSTIAFDAGAGIDAADVLVSASLIALVPIVVPIATPFEPNSRVRECDLSIPFLSMA